MDTYSKIDLHIHSFASSLTKTGDQEIVSDSKIENLPILIDKLIENDVNIVAITDHNIFDKNIYIELKKQEALENCIKKVLPGIEIDLCIEEKNIHVICIFDDTDSTHFDKIEKGFEKKDNYSIDDLGAILRKIELSTILIAHQKCDYKADKSQKTSLSCIGKEKFYKFIGSEFFDALEIQNTKVEGILKNRFLEDNIENIHFMVGSDCHEWNAYPSHHNGIKSVSLQYIKALPTFQGLVMTVTDYTRIYNSIEPKKANVLDCIDLECYGHKKKIRLSDKINVIIGDNSVGKSTLIKYLCDEASKEAIDFLKNHGVEIKTQKLDKNFFAFSEQGKIREMFETTEEKLPIKQKFIDHFKFINKEKYKKIISDILLYYEFIWNHNEKIINNIQNFNKILSVPCLCSNEKHYLSIDINLQEIKNKYTNVVQIFADIYLKFKEFNDYLDLLENEDLEKLKSIRSGLFDLGKKYTVCEKDIEVNRAIQNGFNYSATMYNQEIAKKSSSDELLFSTFNTETQKAINGICCDLEYKFTKQKDIWDTFESFEIETSINQVGRYCFVDKPKFQGKISKELIESFITKHIDINKPLEKLTSSEILSSIKSKRINDKTADNIRQLLNILYSSFIETYFATTVEIKRGNDKLQESNSAGINALYYIDILSETFSKPIFIIDQPEDDVSQSRISTDLILSLRCLSKKAQIILVTHNPQLVVNLDADNVIILKKGENQINFYSGPLEYKEHDYSILDLVASTLDGGTDVIKKRWKRYDKTRVQHK